VDYVHIFESSSAVAGLRLKTLQPAAAAYMEASPVVELLPVVAVPLVAPPSDDLEEEVLRVSSFITPVKYCVSPNGNKLNAVGYQYTMIIGNIDTTKQNRPGINPYVPTTRSCFICRCDWLSASRGPKASCCDDGDDVRGLESFEDP
jgi:hypothetical protein